ncbi:MAG: hypothetical protein Q9181_007641 [Wetmoreana brouardii]
MSPSPDASARVLRDEQSTEPEISIIEGQFRSGKPPYPSYFKGIGLGTLDPQFLTRERWPLHTAQGQIQYRKFVQTLINRVRAGESNDAETCQFLDMFGTLKDWAYLTSIVENGMLPELDENGPVPTNVQMTSLIKHVQGMIDAKEQERVERMAKKHTSQAKPPQSAESVMAETREHIARLLFGPTGEANATPAMKRLLTSWVETGYPSKEIQETIDKRGIFGKTMSRDSLGLPRGLGERSPRSPKYQNPEAQRKLAPVYVESSRRSRGPIEKAPTKALSPAQEHSVAKSAEHTKEQSQETGGHGYSSVELEDSPPESLLGELKSKEKIAVGKNWPNLKIARGQGFRDFEKVAMFDYQQYIRPPTKKGRVDSQSSVLETAPSTKETTADGTVVVKGFDKPSPLTSDAMLKEIDDAAANWSLMGSPYVSENAVLPEVAPDTAMKGEESEKRDFVAVEEEDTELLPESDNITPRAGESVFPEAFPAVPAANTPKVAIMDIDKVKSPTRLLSLIHHPRPRLLKKMQTFPTLHHLPPSALASLLLSQPSSTPSTIAIIDVRDSDHAGGHIRSSLHVPSSTLDYRIPDLVRTLEGKEKVFERERERLLGAARASEHGDGERAREKEVEGNGVKVGVEKKVIEEGLRDEDIRDAVGKEDEVEKVDESGEERDETGDADGQEKRKEQEVWVLDGGFVKWQEMYGDDERLTDDFARDIWRDY